MRIFRKCLTMFFLAALVFGALYALAKTITGLFPILFLIGVCAVLFTIIVIELQRHKKRDF